MTLIVLVGLGASCSLIRSLDEYEQGQEAADDAGCPIGFADCDGEAANGCETDIMASIEHCGACHLPCAAPSAQVACLDGACQLSACLEGSADCNGIFDDGCETDTSNSMDHCGGCGRVCPPAHAQSGTCTAGACSFTCKPGFGDCDASSDNGCEVALTTDLEHCGSCGNACFAPPNAHAVCDDGLGCTWACDEQMGDCDGDEGNGCETSLAEDTERCGACDVSCPPDFVCEGGICLCTNHAACDWGGGGKCLGSGAARTCRCGETDCEPGEVCLPGEVCGQN